MKNFEEVMKDIGVNNFDELLDWIKNNSENQLAKDLKEFLAFVKEQEG